MFIESGRFDLWNTSMRLIGDVRPPEINFKSWVSQTSLICITHRYVLRPGIKLKPSLDRFDLTCLAGKERHSNDKTKRCLGHNSYYYLGRNSLIFKTCQYS